MDAPVLVADVGGTNLNLALLVREGRRFRLLRKTRYRTQEEGSLLEPLLRFLAQDASLRPGSACLAGAGPVHAHRIHLTNAPWDIDGAALEAALGIPVQLVNDFLALSCGVLQLDLTDPDQVTPLPHEDGSLPQADPQGPILVVGAGTGLGVGFIVPTPVGPRAFPSEGGHVGLPVFDDDSLALWQHLGRGLPGPPGAELAVSGQGLANIFRFLLDTQRVPGTPTAAAILALPPIEQPGAISVQAASDPVCARAMGLFVDLYARVCADLSLVFLPRGGLFLAGGIPAKNTAHFLDDGRFMARFERHYRAHAGGVARATPVHVVRDYDLSLYGAALAPTCTGP